MRKGIYFLFACLMMSLAWSLRGQFGHQEGAIIPGAAAALLMTLGNRKEIWRKSIGGAVAFSAIGFSLGGHMAYGKLIEHILSLPHFFTDFPALTRIFLIGGIWGGLGMSFLGFALFEKRYTSGDLGLLAFLGLFWFIPLGIFNLESYDLVLFGLGFAILHFYNLFFRKSSMLSILGFTGLLGFGLAFLIAVALLHAGFHGNLGHGLDWWKLRDQIIGLIGAFFVCLALWIVQRQRIEPEPGNITLIQQKGGLVFLVVLIPLINGVNVLDYWIRELGMPVSPAIWITAIGLGALSLLNLFFIVPADTAQLIERSLDYFITAFVTYFIWILSFLSILNKVIPFGMTQWEPALTLFLAFSVILTFLIPFVVFRSDADWAEEFS